MCYPEHTAGCTMFAHLKRQPTNGSATTSAFLFRHVHAKLNRNRIKMASCEPSRTRAYHADLRWRIVYRRYILFYFGNTGTGTKKNYPESQTENLRLLTEVDQFLIMELVIKKPGTYLSEIKWQLEKTTGTTVSESTICQFLKQCGFTRRRI